MDQLSAGNDMELFSMKCCVTLWDCHAESTSRWDRLPGCWLSTISAGGLVLSHEARGGCSVGIWIETSIAFIPVKHTNSKASQ